MPPQSGQTVAADWEAVVGTSPEDNIHDDYWLFNRLSKGKGFKSVDGGRTINWNLEYALNTTVAPYTDTDTISTTRVDVFDEAIFQWKEIAGTAVMSELEAAKNQGSGGKFDLLEAKLENLRNTFKSVINEGLFSAGTGSSSKQIGGLQHIVSSTPTTGTVGGINRATYSFWRNQQASGAKTSTAFDNLRATMRTVYNDCSNGVASQHPEFAVTDQTVFEGYESLLIANEQVTSKEKSQADAGFKNEYLMFKDIPISYDNDCLAGALYFLNTRNLKLCYQKGRWMKAHDAIRPANQTVDVFQVLTIANLVSNNSRRLGVVTAIT